MGYFNLATLLHDTSKMAEAEKYYRKALDLSPDNSTAYMGLGTLLVKKGSYDEAEELYKKAILLNPKNANAYIYYGLLLVDKRFFKEAEYFYHKAVEVDPANGDAYYNLARLHERRRLFDSAEVLYKKIVELNVHRSIAYVSLGALAFRKDNLEEAEAYIKRAIEADPLNATAYCNLGNILMHKGAFDEAEEYCNKAINLDPNLSIAYCNLGQLYLNFKKLINEAETFFTKSIETDQLNASAYCGLGNIEILKFNRKKAYEYHCHSAALDPYQKETFAMLFNYSVEVNPDKDKHFYRFIYLSFRDNRFQHVSEALMYAENIDAAMLVNRMSTITDVTKWDVFALFFDLIQSSIDRTYPFRCLIQSWKKENKHPKNNLLSTAIINYYSGDPIEAYRIFDYEIEGNDLELDLFGQYYFCLSSTSFLEEERAVFSAALQDAESDLESTSLSTTERYYAAL